MTMRKIILHYHLFKNAGSSVDRILKESYADQWRNVDRSQPGEKISAADMQSYLEENPQLKAVSSHQLVPPLPRGEFEILPLVFLRDPIARIRSAWTFEWQNQLGLSTPKGSLEDYISEKLEKGKGSVIANFQVFRLSNQHYNTTRPTPGLHELERLTFAMDFVRGLEFFGIVEKFDQSLYFLKHCAGSQFPELDCKVYHENVSEAKPAVMKQTHNRLKKAIGNDLYEEVLRRNRLDLQLYSYACGLFDERLAKFNSQISDGQKANNTVGMDSAESQDSDKINNSGVDDSKSGSGPSIAA